jgi:hypothetical protein
VNGGVIGLGHFGTVTAARMTSNGHDVWRADVGLPEVDEIWAVAVRQRRVWPAQPHRGLAHSGRRSALCTAESIRRISLLDIQCDREGIQVGSHNRSWMPCSPSRQRGRRTCPDQGLLI